MLFLLNKKMGTKQTYFYYKQDPNKYSFYNNINRNEYKKELPQLPLISHNNNINIINIDNNIIYEEDNDIFEIENTNTINQNTINTIQENPIIKEEGTERNKTYIDNYKKQEEEIYLNEIKDRLLKSEIGLYNAGGSCYMASIIQILIHSEKFLDKFLTPLSYQNQKGLSYLLFIFIKYIAYSKENAIEIKQFSENYNKINNKFNGKKGNNPMVFFNEFIKRLDEENNGGILNLYMGKKDIKFEGMSELDYEEDFIFYLLTLDKNKKKIIDAYYDVKEFEDDENIKLVETIKVTPEILIINLNVENIEYNFEEYIYIEEIEYKLKAINRYTNFHSVA